MNAATLPLNEVLSRLMFSKRIKPTELARKTNLPQPTVQRIVARTTPKPHRSTLDALANFFTVSIEQLKGLEPIPGINEQSIEPSLLRIPIIEWKNVGTNNQILDSAPFIMTESAVTKVGFALTMNDASMEPLFPKDTLLIFDTQKAPKDRSYVLVQLKNHPTAIFRQLLVDISDQFLKPLSPDFSEFRMIKMSTEDKIIGVLVQARRDYTE